MLHYCACCVEIFENLFNEDSTVETKSILNWKTNIGKNIAKPSDLESRLTSKSFLFGIIYWTVA